MEFIQLEFVQEEIKDDLEDWKDKNSKFDQDFDAEHERVKPFKLHYNISFWEFSSNVAYGFFVITFR